MIQATAQPALPADDNRPWFDLDAMNREMEASSAERRVAWGLENFPGRIVLTSSFGAQSAVCLHMVAAQRPDIPLSLIHI